MLGLRPWIRRVISAVHKEININWRDHFELLIGNVPSNSKAPGPTHLRRLKDNPQRAMPHKALAAQQSIILPLKTQRHFEKTEQQKPIVI